MSIQKTNDTEGKVAPGDTVGYELTLTVQNGPITAVTVEDVLPANFGTPSAISDGGTYDAASRTITWTLANVADGRTLTYDIVIATATQGGSYLNTATITEGPCVAGDCDDDSVVPVWRVAITKDNDATAPLAEGADVVYTLTFDVQNGPIDNMVVTDTLPAEVVNPRDFSVAPVSVVGKVITWNLTDVADGDTISYTASIADGTLAGSYTNVAEITEGPCVAGDCDDDSTVTVKPPSSAVVQVQKLFDLDGDVSTTDDRRPMSGWTFNTAITGGTISATTGTSGSDGFTPDFLITIPSSGTEALVDVAEVLLRDTKFLQASCVVGDETRGTLSGVAVNDISVKADDVVTCTFVNTIVVEEATGTPTITPPPTDAGSHDQGQAGSSLLLILFAIGGLVAVLGVLTPTPARVRRQGRRG